MRVHPFATCVLILSAASLLAQHDVSPANATAGRDLFRTNCALCHGNDGDFVPGVHMGVGKFRQAYSDQELIKIIRSGIPGTEMPPNDVTEVEAANIVAYFRNNAATAATLPQGGDALRGKVIFEGKGECLTCHRVRGNGSRLGPELTDVGASRRSDEVQRKILEPSANVRPEHRFYRVVTKSGTTVTGRLLEQTTFTVLLIDKQDRLRAFVKADLREHSLLKTSQMPSYRGKLSDGEVADVVTYLASLKGINP